MPALEPDPRPASFLSQSLRGNGLRHLVGLRQVAAYHENGARTLHLGPARCTSLSSLLPQGGGPTAVINQSLAGVVLEARKYPFITQVYGARFGVRGIVNEDFLG